MSRSKSAKFYSNSPESRAKKKVYDSEFQKKPAQVKKRVEANRANRVSQSSGKTIKGDGKDYDHAVRKFVRASTNRGRKGEGNR